MCGLTILNGTEDGNKLVGQKFISGPVIVISFNATYHSGPPDKALKRAHSPEGVNLAWGSDEINDCMDNNS